VAGGPAQRQRDARAIFPGGEEVLRQAHAERVGAERGDNLALAARLQFHMARIDRGEQAAAQDGDDP
jgi:hypothetical protein